METNFKEQLHETRPYWKVIVSLTFSLIATILFIYVGFRLLGFFMPFVIGWFISYIASPIVNWLEKRVKIVKKLGSALIIIAVLGAVGILIYFIGSKLWKEIASLIQNMPKMYQDLESGFGEIGSSLNGVFKVLPAGLQDAWHTMTSNLDKTMGDWMGIVTFISAYFFIAERDEVIEWAKKVSPEPVVRRMSMVIDNLKFAVGGYFKAQFKIMGVVCLILVIGFVILKVHFYFLLALLIAFLDFLPFFGTGTALIPWALYKLLVKDYRMSVGLIILYGVTQLVRQLIQPKLVGDSMGMQPLPTLLFLYIGYKAGGIFGMIFAVPIGMIVINQLLSRGLMSLGVDEQTATEDACRIVYKAGAFDYILEDVKILMEGILSLWNKRKASASMMRWPSFCKIMEMFLYADSYTKQKQSMIYYL